VLKLVTIGLFLSGCVVGEVKDFNEPNNPDPVDPTPDPTPDPEPAATGSLRITMTTTTQAGTFAPNNVVAVWLEDAAGTFVKTIDRHSGVRTQHLVAWRTAAGAGDTDGVSGASRLDHGTPITLTYRLKDQNQQVIPDGTYTVRMESTELNAVAANENNQGTFTFTKGAVADTQTGLSNGGFTNVSIEFTPP
jgi:hypothetical protein